MRRTSEIGLIDAEDRTCIEAKNQLYRQVNGRWEMNKAIAHRQMSNNSIYYQKKPSREMLHWHLEQMRYSGEPGWINEEAGRKRRPNFNGCNPCGEILLDSHGLCNLTTVNVMGFVKDGKLDEEEEAGRKRRPNFNGCNPCGEILLDSHGLCNLTTVNVMGFVKDGKLDEEGLLEAQRLSARAGYRMTCQELEIHRWNVVQQRDRLLGCSLTGWQDMVNATGMNREEEAELLKKLRSAAHEAAEKISARLGGAKPLLITTIKPEGTLSLLPTVEEAELLKKLRSAAHEAAEKISARLGGAKPLLITTIKPEGTLSLLPTVSNGVHYSHAPYYIRRVRISATDPLCRVCEELGYPVLPEVGQDPDNPVTKVVEFPVKAPAGRVKADVSAIQQLENYKMFMQNYVDHNCSITVHVRDQEWDEVEQWVWDNWDEVVALSFLSYDDNFYELLPYEEITQEEYEKRREAMRPFNPSLLSKYEHEETELDIGASECVNGVCPVR